MRYDERDTLFSRLSHPPGSPENREYQDRHPKKKDIRSELKAILIPGTSQSMKKPQGMKAMDPPETLSDHEFATKLLLQEQTRVARALHKEALEMKVHPHKRELDAPTMTMLVKEFVRLNGLEALGICKLEKDDLYSHRGFNKGPHKYGDTIDLDYQYAIIMVAPMELDYINRAPNMELYMASMLAYAKSSEVAAKLSMYIKSLGYDNTTDCSYLYHSPISFIMEKAGLGQMGRSNAVIHPQFGNRTKVSAVLCNLPLEVDKAVDYGFKEFCELCRRCQQNCPVDSIPAKASYADDGTKYWGNDEIACMKMWKKTGTSCGICMSACPFSQGVAPELVYNMKGNKDIMRQILKEHDAKHGKRECIESPLPFMPKQVQD